MTSQWSSDLLVVVFFSVYLRDPELCLQHTSGQVLSLLDMYVVHFTSRENNEGLVLGGNTSHVYPEAEVEIKLTSSFLTPITSM